MKIVIVGLGKMGLQIITKLQTAGHDVLGVAHRQEQADQLSADGINATTRREDAVAFFGDEQAIVWLMIPSDSVDTELDAWTELLSENSIIIDGGNSDFRLTSQRSQRVGTRGMQLIDVGTSGGVHGLENGFSLMAGGDSATFATVEPIVQVLAQPAGAYQYFGKSGSGHYVKMVHNSIEYGMMQSLAEGYRMLEEGAYKGEINLGDAGEVWQHGSVVTSWLNELTRQAVTENPKLEGIEGIVAESGETRWTLESAHELGVPLPVIQAAFDVRLKSQTGEVNFATKLLAAMRNKFGGHAINVDNK